MMLGTVLGYLIVATLTLDRFRRHRSRFVAPQFAQANVELLSVMKFRTVIAANCSVLSQQNQVFFCEVPPTVPESSPKVADVMILVTVSWF